MEVSSEQLQKYREDGYLIVEDFFTASECDTLRERAFQTISEADFSNHPMTVFETGANKQASSDYFLTSGDKIRFFMEEGAVDENGKLKVPREKAVNKIGHALHALDPEFKKITFSDKMKGIARSLELKKPAIVQSMVIFKQPNIGGIVNPHQDSTFLFTTPMNLVGFWIALEDADLDNGCLWFVPGSHKQGVSQRMVRTVSESGVGMTFEGSPACPNHEEYIATPVKKGTLVVIHGEVVHKSKKNESQRSRNIYTFHLYDAGTSEWSKDNWLQPTQELSFTLLYD